jgi:hypothetical protein
MFAVFVIKRETLRQRVFYQKDNCIRKLTERIGSFLRPLLLTFRPTMLYFCATLRRWRASVAREISSSFAARR